MTLKMQHSALGLPLYFSAIERFGKSALS